MTKDNWNEGLFGLSDILVDELLSLPEEELLRELEEKPELRAALDSTRSLMLDAVSAWQKKPLLRARATIEEKKSQFSGADVDDLSIEQCRVFLAKHIANDNQSHKRITLAARNGGDLVDEEIRQIVADLIDLGAVADIEQSESD